MEVNEKYFHTNSTTDIPPMHYTENNSAYNFAYSDTDKIELLHTIPTQVYRQCTCHSRKWSFWHFILIPVNKAEDHDSISHNILKSCKETISKPLCLLFNKSLSSKTFPDCWKLQLAHVISLLKKYDPSITSNYRPV